MTWFKVDDTFHSHSKVRKVAAECPAALALWVIAGSWSSANLTDGFVPDHQLPWLLPDAATLAPMLVNARLWRRARGGYRFHDWTQCNPIGEAVRADREAAKQRMRKVREKRKHAGQNPNGSGEHAANVRAKFSLPDPTPPTGEGRGLGGEPPDPSDGAAVDHPHWRALAAIGQLTAHQRALNQQRAAETRAALKRQPTNGAGLLPPPG